MSSVTADTNGMPRYTMRASSNRLGRSGGGDFACVRSRNSYDLKRYIACAWQLPAQMSIWASASCCLLRCADGTANNADIQD
jgi:hypothetical protein